MSTPPIAIIRPDLQRLGHLLDGPDEFGSAAGALETELSRTQVVRHDEILPGVAIMSSTVRCREENSGKEYTLTLVYPEDAAGEDKVSILAPVGIALLGLTIGQTVDWLASNGKTLKLTLLETEYQSETAGDYVRWSVLVRRLSATGFATLSRPRYPCDHCRRPHHYRRRDRGTNPACSNRRYYRYH